jgi:hypothetical protein
MSNSWFIANAFDEGAMQRFAALALLIVTLTFGLMPAARSAEQAKGFIYAATDKSSTVAIVVDVGRRGVEIQDKRSARISIDDEFVGNYEECGNEAFYCAGGLLEIVIPKNMPMKQWEYHGLSCQSVAQSGGDLYRITCRSPKYRGRPTFTYSLSRGVVSIESCPIGGSNEYELRGERGLFFPGSNP